MRRTRRSFLSNALLATGAGLTQPAKLFTPGLSNLVEEIQSFPASADPVRDEDFWHLIKQAYSVSPTITNLNNGGVCPQPRVVQEAVEHYNRLSNEAPSYYMWRILDRGREPLREKLAGIAGCDPEEVAINRNSSEALETVIFGLRLNRGDEVVLTKQCYPNMINAWKQREHRDGIVLKWLNLDVPTEDKDYLVQSYVNAFTQRTRIAHVTHMINWNGQLMPAKAIAREAHQRGIEVVLDAAHSFAHIQYNIPDLECDYFGASLHKWMCAPFGSGLLWVKKEKISQLYPLLAAPEPEDDNIRKFENLGTRSFAIEQATAQAADFHLMIGAERKQKRLQYLKTYWTSRVTKLPGVTIGTPTSPDYGCAIALLQIDGHDPSDIGTYLFNKHKIHTVPIKWENINGVRITPNVYTLTSDLDRLVRAIERYPRL